MENSQTNVEALKQKINIIVACTNNNIIGINNDLPWKLLKDDMLHFKNTTTNHICIMGFNTWESFGKRPLPNRINIVITSKNTDDPILHDYSKNYDYSKTYIVNSIDDALFLLSKDHIKYGSTAKDGNGFDYLREVFVIGGGMTYQHFMNLNLVDKIIMTSVEYGPTFGHVDDSVVYFPVIDFNEFSAPVEISTQEVDERNEFRFKIVEFTKI